MPAAIVISSIILAIGFYSVQSNKQKSIERQLSIKLQNDKKDACFDIYKVESDRWSNTKTWKFGNDKCLIIYSSSDPKSKEECDELYAIDDDSDKWSNLNNGLCKNGSYVKIF